MKTAAIFLCILNLALHAGWADPEKPKGATGLFCGPDCVYIICSLLDRKAAYADILRDMDLSDKGATMRMLKDSLFRRASIHSEGYRLSYPEFQSRFASPAIVRLTNPSPIMPNFLAHWVVVISLTDSSLRIISPPDMLYTMERSEFEKLWAGEVLLIEPKERNRNMLTGVIAVLIALSFMWHIIPISHVFWHHHSFSKATAFLLLAFGSHQSVLAATGGSLSKEDLLALVDAYRHSITDIDMTYTGHTTILGEDPVRKNGSATKQFNIRLKYADDMKYREFNTVDPSREDERFLSSELMGFNGEIMKKYRSGAKENSFRGSVAPNMNGILVEHNYIYQAMMWSLPTDSGADQYVAARKDLAALLSLPPNGGVKVESDRDAIFGTNAVVLDVNNKNATIWLDIEHGGIPRQIIWRDGSNGQIVEKHTIPELQEESGVFFPKRCTLELFGLENGPEVSYGKLVTRIDYDVVQLSVNSGLSQDDFTIDFPDGTFVVDEILGISYVVGPQAQIRSKLLDDVIAQSLEDIPFERIVEMQQVQIGLNEASRNANAAFRRKRFFVDTAVVVLMVLGPTVAAFFIYRKCCK